MVRDRSVVLLDTYPIWLDAVAQVVFEMGLAVAGRTTSRTEALSLLEAHKPDVFVTDLDAGAGTSWIQRAAELHPDMKVIVLATQDDRGVIEAALAAGATAYVIKRIARADLAAVIRQALDPCVYLRPIVAVDRPAASLAPAPDPDGADVLTRREVEILRLVAEGMTNAQIAQHLWVTQQTVKFHLSNIFRKLNVSNRTQASRRARDFGILERAANAGDGVIPMRQVLHGEAS